jgi:hypothetical protein
VIVWLGNSPDLNGPEPDIKLLESHEPAEEEGNLISLQADCFDQGPVDPGADYRFLQKLSDSTLRRWQMVIEANGEAIKHQR